MANLEEKVQLLGEKQIELFVMFTKLTNLTRDLNDSLVKIEKINFHQIRNELTYLHNEIREINTELGRYGDVPKIKPKKKYKNYEV